VLPQQNIKNPIAWNGLAQCPLISSKFLWDKHPVSALNLYGVALLVLPFKQH
jgi:hypothetical protein